MPDRFEAAPETGPYEVGEWKYSARVLPLDAGTYDVYVLTLPKIGWGGSAFDQQARFVEAARMSLAETCADPRPEIAASASASPMFSPVAMIVRLRC